MIKMKNNTENKAVSFTQQDLKLVLGPVCLIVLDNGDQALYVNGEYVESACSEFNEASIEDLSRRIARALQQPLRQVELPVPEKAGWSWGDITEELASRASVMDARTIVTLIESRLPGGRAIHFCCHPVLSGSNHDLWFPLQEGEELFAAVERVMTMNNMAINVTSVLPSNEYPNGMDWTVVYNQKLSMG